MVLSSHARITCIKPQGNVDLGQTICLDTLDICT